MILYCLDMKNIILLLNLLFLLSCTGKSGEHDFESLPSVSIFGEYLEEEQIFSSSAKIQVIDSCFIVCDSKQPDGCLSILDERTGRCLDQFGMKGNGPGEFSYPVFLGKSFDRDTIYVANFPQKVYAYAQNERGKYELVKECKILIRKKDMMEFPMRMCRLQNGYYVMTTVSGGKDFFILLDKECQEIKRFGAHPIRGMNADVCDFIPFDGRMTSYGNSFYYATFKYGYIARYDISDIGEVVMKWEKFMSEPQVTISEANIQMKSSVNLTGFYGVSANDKYIFALYSGVYFRAFIDEKDSSANVPRTLVVFNTDGAIVGKFRISHKSTTLCLSEDNNYLYLWNIEPDVSIEKFKVKDFLDAK